MGKDKITTKEEYAIFYNYLHELYEFRVTEDLPQNELDKLQQEVLWLQSTLEHAEVSHAEKKEATRERTFKLKKQTL